MKSFLCLLLAIAACTFFGCVSASPSPMKSKNDTAINIRLCGGTPAMRAFLRQLGEVTVFANADELYQAGYADHILVVLLPEYSQGRRVVQEATPESLRGFLDWKGRGTRFYVENYPSRDYLAREVFSYFLTGNENHFNRETIFWNEDVLQARNHFYFPTAINRRYMRTILAEVGSNLNGNRFPLLMDDQEGCVSSVMNLSDFQPEFQHPDTAWRKCLTALWSDLTKQPKETVATALDRVWPKPYQLSHGTDVATALKNAVEWHLHCGLMPEPDGSKGIYEMLMSGDFSLRKNYRTDSVLMTAALLAGYAKYTNDQALLQIAKNLADFLLDRGIQQDNGLLRWYDHSQTVYANDSGRHGLALLYLWRTTGDKRYLDCAERLAKACLAWLGPNGLYNGTFSGPEIPTQGESRTPVFYGEMAAFLLSMNTPEATDAVLKFAEQIHLNDQSMGHSKPDVLSRALLLYASIHTLAEVDQSAKLTEILDFFQSLQEPCGGFREDNIFQRVLEVEAAVANGNGHDRIGDQLYCNNYLYLALGLLRRGKLSPTMRTQVEKMYQGVQKYLLDIQLASNDPRFNGAWMRAYNMDLQEYHGIANDADWGPYNIMTGWIMGYIPLTLLQELNGMPFINAIEF